MTLPQEFVNRMGEMLREEELAAFLSSYDRPMPRALRLNPLKMREGMALDLTMFHLEPVPWAMPYGLYYGAQDHRGGNAASGHADPAEISAGDIRPGRSPLHEAGLYYIQEPSAMATAALAELAAQTLLTGVLDVAASHGERPGALPCSSTALYGSPSQRSGASFEPPSRPGQKILDLCAAPGGKTTMLSSFLGGEGLLVANEIEGGRARILSQNVERMGIRNAIVTNESPERLAGRFPAFFDQVIVDAPCSGEGMFRREEKAIMTWSLTKVASCAQLQAQILDHAAVMVKSGGLLVYSTCTFAPEEDEGQVCRFLTAHPEYSPVDLPALLGEERMQEYGFEKGRVPWAGAAPAATEGLLSGASSCAVRLWPHRLKGEGHFVAVFRRAGEYVPDPVPQGSALSLNGTAVQGREGGSVLRAEEWQAVRDCAAENLAADVVQSCAKKCGADFMRFGDEIYLAPYASQIPMKGLKIVRAGLHLGTRKKGRFEPAHALAMALRPEEAARCVNLPADDPRAAAYLRGESLPCDPALKGWTLITFDGIAAGWGKASGGMLRNHYPKGLRRAY